MNKFGVILSLAAESAFAINGKCRVLALSGGGNKGAWEAGVMWGLLHYGDPADFAWDVNTGISAGALNTGLISVYATGDELQATEDLSDIWKSIETNKQIYEPWGKTILSVIPAVVNKVSLFNTDPGLQFLKDHIYPHESIKRKFTNAAGDVNTGEYVTMDQTNCAFEDLPTCMLSSASIPGVFQPRSWGGHDYLMDGGTIWDINIDSAIN